MCRRTPNCACGNTYAAFRTGLKFHDVRRMLWDQADPSRPGWFRQKRRRAVLGFWRELKISMYLSDHAACPA
jgi:hypothetical protein